MVRKTIRQARQNLDTSTAYIAERYVESVKVADWQGPAGSEEAEKNFKDAMAKVVVDKTRQKGVKESSNAEWQKNAEEKGGAVIATRVAESLDEYERNFGPILDAMNSAAERLPPKGLDPMVNIDKRLKPVVAAAIAAGKKR